MDRNEVWFRMRRASWRRRIFQSGLLLLFNANNISSIALDRALYNRRGIQKTRFGFEDSVLQGNPPLGQVFLLSHRLRGGSDESGRQGWQRGEHSNNGFKARSGGVKRWKKWGSSSFYRGKRRSEWSGGDVDAQQESGWGNQGMHHEQLEDDADEEDMSSSSTSARMQDEASLTHQHTLNGSKAVIASEMPLNILRSAAIVSKQAPPIAANPEDVDGNDLQQTLKSVFGYSDFREGQEQVVRRVLSGRSTIFVSATGSGKSLCYLIPAAKSPGIVLVISPLIALIQDQIANMPEGLRGAALHSMLTPSQYARVVADLQSGSVKILFLSPERLFSDGFISLAASLPPISFVCVDEVHCASEWAHNFRPSYLRLRSMLTDRLGITCLLGLTATATREMQSELRSLLSVPPDGIIRTPLLRPNLHLSVSRGNWKDDIDGLGALGSVLSGLHEMGEGGVIVYCSLQRTCDRLCSALLAQGFHARAYHAGCSDEERVNVQAQFLQNEIFAVIATVAFGMGINKHDVRGVVHYNSPSSVEAYVQQVGRCGRDGRPGYCHAFINDQDFIRMRSVAHSHSVDIENVAALLSSMYSARDAEGEGRSAMASKREGNKAGGRKRQVTGRVRLLGDLCRRLDLYPETVETILSFLDNEQVLALLNNEPAKGVVSIAQVEGRPQTVPEWRVMRAIRECGRLVREGLWAFDFEQVALTCSKSVQDVHSDLKKMEARSKGRVRVDVRERAWLVDLKNNPQNVTALSMKVFSKLQRLERSAVRHVDDLWRLLSAYLYDPGGNIERGEHLQARIEEYFNMDDHGHLDAERNKSTDELIRELPEYMPRVVESEEQAEAQGAIDMQRFREDVMDMLQEQWDLTKMRLNPRAIVRVLHGIHSPAFPAQWWYQNGKKWWGKYAMLDFDVCLDTCAEIMRMPEVRTALSHRARPPKAIPGEDKAAEKLDRIWNYLETAEEKEKITKAATLSLPKGYRGESKGMLRCGYGVQEWKREGETYWGAWIDDVCEGFGRWKFADGAVYEGQMHKGKPEGWGCLTEKNRTYEGQWTEGLPHGRGVERRGVGGAENLLVLHEAGMRTHRRKPGVRGVEGEAWWGEVVRVKELARESVARAVKAAEAQRRQENNRSRDAAQGSRDAAQGSRDAAQGSRDAAQGSRDAAQGSRDAAQEVT